MAEFLPCVDGVQRIHLRLLRLQNGHPIFDYESSGTLDSFPAAPCCAAPPAASASWDCGSMLAEAASIEAAPADPLAPKPPHFPARAKRVIFLFMHGGPSIDRYLRSQAVPRSRTTASRCPSSSR